MNSQQVEELLLQSLEQEMGGVRVYGAAVGCAVNPELKHEWETYLEQTESHVVRLQEVCVALGIDPEKDTPGRSIVRSIGHTLVEAIETAASAAEPTAAELVACECVVLAEIKDHANWQLLRKCAERMEGEGAKTLLFACDRVEDQEDEHLYHTKGWCRELWIQALGMPAVIPPLEELRVVKTAIGQARAEQASEKARYGSSR